MNDIDRFRGCIVGGAVGDALGYAVEFWDEERIFSRYGRRGIAKCELDEEGLARFSDDTQMTLFIANGLLLSGGSAGDDALVESVAKCYLDWHRTQTEAFPLAGGSRSWLASVPELFEWRAPGNTCLTACDAGCVGSPKRPVNDSKGCGGVMRVAPVGLFRGGGDYARMQRMGAGCAALTHGHELGWLPAAALAQIVGMLAHESGCGMREAVEASTALLAEVFPEARHTADLQALVGRAVELAGSRRLDLDCIHELGEGWVAEETLAIAVFCALRHEGDFEGAVVAAVNHSGDSDSTGAVCGNIVGAAVGLGGIPERFTEHLELMWALEETADDLCLGEPGEGDARTEAWEHKYGVPRDFADWQRQRGNVSPVDERLSALNRWPYPS